MTYSKEDTPDVQQQQIEATHESHIHDVNQATITRPLMGDVHVGNKVYTRSNLEELKTYIAHAVADYQAHTYQEVLSECSSPQPYKFLHAFDLTDAPIFFGRKDATKKLYYKVLQDRWTVLHAKSGAGKSSLLRAGLSPCLIRQGYLPIYLRTYHDPVLTIKRTIAPAKLGIWPQQLSTLSLHEFLGIVCNYLCPQNHKLVLILDQFENFFLQWTQPEERKPFIKALRACNDDSRLPIRFVIAVRKDQFSDLDEIEQILPHLRIFSNQYRLDIMTQEEAQQAIVEPLEKLEVPVSYEPALLDILLEDLFRGEIELPLLQIICTRLYETRSKNEALITLKAYKALGCAEGVLGGYLNDVLDKIPSAEASLMRNVLKEFIRYDRTNRGLRDYQLTARFEAHNNELDKVLTRLVDARLLRQDESEEGTLYELVHEYLLTEIVKWIDPEDQEFKKAQELLERETASWWNHKLLIPRDRLEVLYPYRERFKDADERGWECLLSSALQEDFAIEDWIKTAGELSPKALNKVLLNTNTRARQNTLETLERIAIPQSREYLTDVLRKNEIAWERKMAAKALGKIGNPIAVSVLSEALRDVDRDVRQAAAKALGEIRDPIAIDVLIEVLRDKSKDVRQAAVEALGKIGNPIAVSVLSEALRDVDRDVRQAAAKALGEIRDPIAIDVLIEVLRDKSKDVRQVAAKALGETGSSTAIAGLSEALRDKSKNISQTAAEALGKIGGSAALVVLSEALRDMDGNVRWVAAKGLGEIGDPNAIDVLIEALKDQSKDVRQAAVEALGKTGNPIAIHALTKALKDIDGDVRWLAAKALGEIGNPIALGETGSSTAIAGLSEALRDQSKDVRQAAAEALGKIGGSIAIEVLNKALRDVNGNVRRAAAEALGKIGDLTAVVVLREALRDMDENVRRAAAEALVKVGGSTAITALREALRDMDENVRRAAVETLVKVDSPAAKAVLSEALRDKSKDVRQVVTKALGLRSYSRYDSSNSFPEEDALVWAE